MCQILVAMGDKFRPAQVKPDFQAIDAAESMFQAERANKTKLGMSPPKKQTFS